MVLPRVGPHEDREPGQDPIVRGPLKRWRTRPPGACPICQPNIDAGAIPFAATFPSGHAWPPAHFNCDCYVELVL